jgi:hypothetical protein
MGRLFRLGSVHPIFLLKALECPAQSRAITPGGSQKSGDAVNIGFRVVIVEDALCSTSDAGHDALMTMYRLLFNEQIDLVRAEQLADIWPPA